MGGPVIDLALVAYLGFTPVSNGGLGALRAGSATASVSWHKSASCVTTFTGTVAGLSLSGTATEVFPSSPASKEEHFQRHCLIRHLKWRLNSLA